MDEKMAAALLLALVDNMPKDVLHDMFVHDVSNAEAQMILEGVEQAREMLGR